MTQEPCQEGIGAKLLYKQWVDHSLCRSAAKAFGMLLKKQARG
jgi:hypothetical protein